MWVDWLEKLDSSGGALIISEAITPSLYLDCPQCSSNYGSWQVPFSNIKLIHQRSSQWWWAIAHPDTLLRAACSGSNHPLLCVFLAIILFSNLFVSKIPTHCFIGHSSITVETSAASIYGPRPGDIPMKCDSSPCVPVSLLCQPQPSVILLNLSLPFNIGRPHLKIHIVQMLLCECNAMQCESLCGVFQY